MECKAWFSQTFTRCESDIYINAPRVYATQYVRDGLLRQSYAHMLWPQSTPCNLSKVVFWDDKSGLVLYQVYDSPRLRSDSRPSEPHRDDIKWRLAS